MSTEGLDRIVAELQSGTNVEENFHRLFDRFYDTIYRFFSNRGFPADECFDLTQEVFLRVYRSIESYRRESRFEGWLSGILVRTYYNAMRWRRAKLRSAPEVPLADASESGGMIVPEPGAKTEDPEGNALMRERVDLLERAISELPPQMRRTLLLRLQGLSYSEVARILGLSVETVKSHLFHSRRRLKKVLRKLDEVAG